MNRFISYVCLLVTLIVSTSCSKDEINNNSLQGTWKLTSWVLKTPIDLNNDGDSGATYMSGCLNGSELKFTDNSNGTLFFSASVSYNTSNEDGTLFFMTACSTDSDRLPSPITYTKEYETIIISSNGDSYVLTLEGNELEMSVPNGFTASDIDTFETTVSQDITYIFTKQ